MSDSNEATVVAQVEQGVLTIRLNRPGSMNAFTRQLHAELAEQLRAADRDQSLRTIVITGNGRAFCAGQDLKEARQAAGPDGQPRLSGLLRTHYNVLIKRIRSIEKPVIAAVNGVAAGAGLGLALACDIRLASSEASFVTAFSAIGLVPDSGTFYHLPRLVGWARAAELMWTSERVSAEEALRLGLVNRVYPSSEFESCVNDFAARLASGPAISYALIKRGLNRSMSSDLDTVLEMEAQYQQIAGQSDDYREGVDAFLEKRPPRFSGR